MIVTFTMAFSITPTTFISLLSGFFLAWNSLPLVVFSYLSATLICFLFAKKIDNHTFRKSLTSIEGADVFMNRLQEKQLPVIILTKLSPIFPFAISNFLLSISGVKLKQFLLGGFLGMLPRTCLAIWMGIQSEELLSSSLSEEFSFMKFILLAFTLFSLLGIGWIMKKGVKLV